MCIALTSSCETDKHSLFAPQTPDLIDPSLGLDRSDYQNLTDPNAPKKNADKGPDAKVSADPSEPPIPDLAEILAVPKPPKLGETKLVSIAVTDDVPLKDVLIELARLADVDIEVDASITGGISFRAKDRPFNEVIERIANLAALRYTMKNNVLRVERDTPYVQIYSLDFLNIDRSSQSTVNISTNVLSAGGGGSGGGGGGGINTGSNSSVSSTAQSDFWKQFEESIKQILSYKESKRISSIDISLQPNAPPASAAVAAAAPAVPGAAAPVAAPVAAPAPAAAPAPLAAASGETSFYIMNRQASTLTVSATDQQHALIREFLKRIQANASSQVLIEAKIVEVTLSDQFQSGINWNQLGNSKISFAGAFGTVSDTNAASIKIGSPSQLAFTKGIDLSAAVQLAQTFGTTRTLSSPRLHAINNQQAVLTFAENHVYFELSVQQNNNATTVGTVSTVTVNSTLHTVPIGIILTLQPSINLETEEVTLSVRPTLSKITGTVSDPAVAFLVAEAAKAGTPVSISNDVPVIEVRELDSILKLKSGQVMVIGGLMQDTANDTDGGVPGVMGIPYLGNLFKGVNKTSSLQELVIFIRATIVDSAGNAAKADKVLYQKYTKDPRPLNF